VNTAMNFQGSLNLGNSLSEYRILKDSVPCS